MIFITWMSAYNEQSAQWHIGEKVPSIPRDLIIELQADGDELQYIIDNFVNVPYHKNHRVQVWCGDIAKFIYTGLLP